MFLWGLISPAAAAAAAGDRENLEHMAGLPLEPLHNNGDHRFLYASAGGGGGGGKVGRRRVSKTRNAATPYLQVLCRLPPLWQMALVVVRRRRRRRLEEEEEEGLGLELTC